MSQKNTIKLLAGLSQAARQTKNIIQEKSRHFVEDEILRGNYPSREEFEQLKILVEKLQQDIASMKKT